MALPAPTVVAYLDTPFDPGDVFTLDDTTRGVLDGATYTLGGDVGTDISDTVYNIRVTRGRAMELEQNDTGTLTASLRNLDRDFDPLNTAGPYFDHLTAGSRVVCRVYGQTIFDGTTETWPLSYDPSGRADASMLAVDGFGTLARKEFDEWQTVEGETSGQRITSILNRPEVGWPGGQRNIAEGVSLLQSDLVTWGSNVLNYLQLVNESELGVLFCDRNNVVTFRDRHDLIDATPLVTFSDDGTAVPFHGAELVTGSKVLLNRVGIDRHDGIRQTAEDVDSQAMYGIRSWNRSELLLQHDTQSADMAEFLLSVYKDPLTRISAITVKLPALTASQQGQVAGLDLNDVVRVVWTPRRTGTELDVTAQIVGVEHSISFDGVHTMVLRLAPITQVQSAPFTLDSASLGVLDSDILAF